MKEITRQEFTNLKKIIINQQSMGQEPEVTVIMHKGKYYVTELKNPKDILQELRKIK